jgi:hypothetical protein
MKIFSLFIFLCAIAAVLSGQTDHPAQALTHPASSGQMRPAMVLWNTGLVETITRASLGSRNTWRITHYPQDPTGTKINDYDLYDLDQKTLAPLRSVRNTEEYHLELTFGEKDVTFHKTSAQENISETIPLSTAVQAEGPGHTVFVAGLPLAVGYKTRYAIVDRWGGHGSTRLKTVTLSVSKRTTENTPFGRHGIYEVLIKPDDGSFQIEEKVLAQAPHFPVRVIYTRDGKTYPASEVIAVVSRM